MLNRKFGVSKSPTFHILTVGGNFQEMRTFVILILIVKTINLSAQNRVIYHYYGQSASEYNILKWNINKDSLENYRWLVKETIDNQGRVTRLDFLDSGQLTKTRLCYLPDFIIYSYPNNNTIVEELYDAKGNPMNGVECEVLYKRIYQIDSNFIIRAVELDYFADTVAIKKLGHSTRDIQVELKYLDNVKTEVIEGNYNEFKPYFIRYYLKSFSKYNGRFPVNTEFDMNWFKTSNIEYKEALKSLKKTTANN